MRTPARPWSLPPTPVDANDAEAHAAADAAARKLTEPRKPFAPALSWRARLVLALIAALSLAYCLFFVAPLEVVLPGSSSLSFTIANVWLPLLGLVALVGALIALAASATRGRAFDVILALIAALCVSTLLQEVVLNGNLPTADGTPVDWTIYDKVNLKSALAWFAVVAAFIALARLRPLASRVSSVAACLLIVIAQSVGLGMLGAQYADALARPVVTEEGLTAVSPKSNVIVFILDMFDTKDMDDVMAAYPEAADELTGFTWYHNSLGSVIPTRYGVPYIVTAHDFDPTTGEFTTADLQSWFTDRNLLDVANEQGYSVGVYSDSVTYGAQALEEKDHERARGCTLLRGLPLLRAHARWRGPLPRPPQRPQAPLLVHHRPAQRCRGPHGRPRTPELPLRPRRLRDARALQPTRPHGHR